MLLKFCASSCCSGFLLGRLRVSDQLDTAARFGVDGHGTIQSQDLHCLLHCLWTRHYPLHADLICWVSTCTIKRTHGSKYFLFTVSPSLKKKLHFHDHQNKFTHLLNFRLSEFLDCARSTRSWITCDHACPRNSSPFCSVVL